MGNLYYIMGASGAGKDSVMNFVRKHLNGSVPLLFAHRYITREPNDINENHIYLSEQEFRSRMDAGLFAMHWESHGLFYGLGKEIEIWTQKGFDVIVNGSREYCPVAQRKYENLQPILIEVSPDILRKRLKARKRENAAEIEKRIARTLEIQTEIPGCIRIQNNGALEEAGNSLISLIAERYASFKTIFPGAGSGI